MKLRNFKKKKLLIIIFIIYIFFIILYRDVYEIFGYKISPFLLLGFFLLILSFLAFVNLNHSNANLDFLKFKFISENFIKLILLFLMIFSLFIPPKSSTNLIILWDNLSFLNYIRAFIYILGCTFLPGSSIYKIILKNSSLSTKFKINPFFIKITLYPLISLGFIGVSVLFLDQFNLNAELIGLFLFVFILVLTLLEFVFEKRRNNSINIKISKIKISKYDFIILLLALGVSTISIGFQIGWKYLISGDPWGAIRYANYIGEIDINPLNLLDYPNFWGYISFGLGILGGLPYINIITLLAPFSYLFITSTYLLMRALLFNFKAKYAILSTIFISIFSGVLLYPPVSSLVFVSEFYFIYKSFSYFLLFAGVAIFIVLLNNKTSIKKVNIRNLVKSKDFRLLIISAFFIVISFMTYMFPLLFGIIFLFFYCLFSQKKSRFLNFQYFQYFVGLIFTFFLIFDILMNFYLSNIIIFRFLGFFNYNFIQNIITVIPAQLITYSLFIVLLIIIFIFNFKISKNITRDSRRKKIKFNFRFLLILFSTFLIIEVFSIILEYSVIYSDLSQNFFLFFYSDKIFLNFGFIGILGIYLSYYCSKSSRRLFLTLLSWVIISFIIAFLKISADLVINFTISPRDIPESNIFMTNYWFDRIWLYAIPSLCVFTSIGILEIFKKIKQVSILKKNRIPTLLSKNLIASTFILFSFSGIIFTGFHYGNANYRYTNTQIETLSWISENIPLHSSVLVGDNFFMGVGVKTITFVSQSFFYDIFKEEFNISKCIEQIGLLKNNTIKYAVISQFFISYYLNKSVFTNNILIPNFYNITLYQNGDLSVYYAPYFN